MDHLGHLVPHMGPLGRALDLGQIADGAGEHIHQAGLAGPVVGPVVGGKTVDQAAGEIGLAVEEDAIVGHEHIFEGDHGLPAHGAEARLAHIDALQLVPAVVAGLPAEDQGDAGRIDGHGADNGIILWRSRPGPWWASPGFRGS
jgi:hypothetical protein